MSFIYKYQFDEKQFSLSIEFLKNLCPCSDSKLIDDSNSYNAFNFFIFSIAFSNNTETVTLCENLKTDTIFCGILSKLYEKKDSIEFDYLIDPMDQTFISDPSKRYGRILSYCFYAINLLVLKSIYFSKNIEILKLQLNFIKDENFLAKHLNSEINYFSRVLGIFDILALNMSSMSKTCEDIIDKWNELNVADALLNLGAKNESAKLDSYLCLINIYDDKKIETIPEVQYVLNKLIDMIVTTDKDFNDGQINRLERQITINNQTRIANIYVQKYSKGTNISLYAIIYSLYRLSVNNTMKKKVYFQFEIKRYLKSILEKCNEDETELILQLIAQLSFDKEIVNDLKLDDWFLKKFQSYSSNQFGKGIKLLSDKILWNLKDLSSNQLVDSRVLNASSIQNDSNKDTNKHVMISYNSGSRDLCLKIKKKLEELEHKVWIDVEEIHGSSLEAMAKAVEESACVLMCVTEKYRQSLNCQAEAQYSFRINKPIIPLIMQIGYENATGWIGFIMGDKIFINFTKYDFEECMRRLKHEINKISKTENKQKHIVPIEEPKVNSARNEDKSVDKWSEAQVEEWFNTNNIDDKIKKIILPCSGVFLKQLYDMKRVSPEFYHQSFVRESQVTLKSIIVFNHYFEELFK